MTCIYRCRYVDTVSLFISVSIYLIGSVLLENPHTSNQLPLGKWGLVPLGKLSKPDGTPAS